MIESLWSAVTISFFTLSLFSVVVYWRNRND